MRPSELSKELRCFGRPMAEVLENLDNRRSWQIRPKLPLEL